jgi:hypothetical protein
MPVDNDHDRPVSGAAGTEWQPPRADRQRPLRNDAEGQDSGDPARRARNSAAMGKPRS